MGLTRPLWELSVRFQGGPPGRSRRRHGALAFAHAAAPATAGPRRSAGATGERPLGLQST